MKKLLFLTLLLLACGAEQLISAQESNCAIGMTVTDKDPAGLNVRSKPNVNGKIIARLKHGENETLTVSVFGYSNGWVKIGAAFKDSSGNMFADNGWVSAKMVVVTAGGENGSAEIHRTPGPESPLVTTVPTGTVLQINGFACGDVRVTYQGKTGWLRSIRQ